MAREDSSPAVPETSLEGEAPEAIDLTIEKLTPRLALDSTEGGSSAVTGSCTLSGGKG